MEDLIKQWDGESVIVHPDRPTGAWIIIAIHSTRLGPATGGTRMKPYPDFQSAVHDALRLSESMTFKFALAGMPCGGGKAVIYLPPDFDPRLRNDLLLRYGQLIHQLGGLYKTGPDVGTSPEDMDIIAETGAPYIFARTEAAGGAGNSAPPTALGVFHAIRVLAGHLFGDTSLQGRRVVVQGAGAVGGRVIEQLCEAGANVVFTDVAPRLANEHAARLGVVYVPPDDIFDVECDIFSPCALGGVLNQANIARLKCRGIAGAANNQLAAPEDAARLRERGITYAPDFCINIGGAMAITGMELLNWTREDANRRVVEAVEKTLKETLDLAARERITTDAAARRIARQRLA